MQDSEGSESSLVQARKRIEQQYFTNLTEGRRLRKNPKQIDILIAHFNRRPVWDYAEKVAIAEELNMTFGQVSKWNWDHRKKMGVSTKRSKGKNNQEWTQYRNRILE